MAIAKEGEREARNQKRNQKRIDRAATRMRSDTSPAALNSLDTYRSFAERKVLGVIRTQIWSKTTKRKRGAELNRDWRFRGFEARAFQRERDLLDAQGRSSRSWRLTEMKSLLNEKRMTASWITCRRSSRIAQSSIGPPASNCDSEGLRSET